MDNLRYIAVSLTVYLISFNSLIAQDFWEELPFPDTIQIACLAINNGGNLFVGSMTENSNFNGVYRSIDTGQTWQQVLNLGTYAVLSLEISNEGTLYAGSNGHNYLYRSNDNGQNWDTLTLPFAYNVVKILCKGSDTVFVSQWGNDGAILLRSTDNGNTFEECFLTTNHASEYVSDIAITPNGDIYLSLMCFFPGIGGVYKSDDQGLTWQEMGMLNHQVQQIEVNGQGDVFIGVYNDFDVGAGGLYAIYHGSDTITTCIYGPQVNGIAINSEGYIYAGIGWPDGVIVSKDNGNNFTFENNGLPAFPIGKLCVDSNDYIYALFDGLSHFMYRSVLPTVTSAIDNCSSAYKSSICLIPNPVVSNILKGKLSASEFQDGAFQLKITSLDGKVILSKKIDIISSQFEVNVFSLSSGFYNISLQDKKKQYSATFIKL
jgi:hypothetical protein